jgi:hypothetical protein
MTQGLKKKLFILKIETNIRHFVFKCVLSVRHIFCACSARSLQLFNSSNFFIMWKIHK